MRPLAVWHLLGALFCTGLPLQALAQPDQTYTSQMLHGARTASIHYTLKPGEGCGFGQTLPSDASSVINGLRAQGLVIRQDVPDGFIPDISILVLLETHRAEVDFPDGLCNMFVKLEVIHQTIGTLRYSGAQLVLGALVYRTFRYGSAPKDNISSAALGAAVRSLHDFEAAYRDANRPLN